MMLADKILDALRAPSAEAPNESRLARRLGMDRKGRSLLRRELQSMLQAGQIAYVQGDRIKLADFYDRHHLDRSFPRDVEREAEALPGAVRDADLEGRRDYRDIPTITIDPDDARDFDDALSLETLDHGVTRVGVHIADVSHYVRPGSALDREALKRGNSTYLVGSVVPMLPERLSNGLCSLVEGEDRLTLAALFSFDKAGRLVKTDFARTVICSRKRLSYRQAYALLTLGDFEALRRLPSLAEHQTAATGRPLSSLTDLELVDLQGWVRKLWAIAKKLRADRMVKGSLDLDMPETKVLLDAEGRPERIYKVVHDESHQLIEEYMLAANEAVARLTRTHKLASIYRVHDDPDDAKLDAYREFALSLGLSCGNLARRPEMVALLAAAGTHSRSRVLKGQLLRSLRKACYRASPDGHYGLHKDDYTHFTSPIRRYADLVVHRGLDHVLTKWLGSPGALPAPAPAGRFSLDGLAEHLSQTEVNSQEAERESFRSQLVDYFERELARKPRPVHRALATSPATGGVFIELTESMVFGLLVAPRGRTAKLPKVGTEFDVVVSRVDRERRLIDFELA
jgi:ribonuclease R